MNLSLKIYLVATVCLINFTPYGAVAADGLDNPWPLYTPALQAAATIGRTLSCLKAAEEVCEDGLDYCLMSEQEKISYYLQICYEEKFACDNSCNDDAQICRDSGTPSPECQDQWVLCDAKCVSEGTQCTTDAINGNHEQLTAVECYSEWSACKLYWEGVCIGSQ